MRATSVAVRLNECALRGEWVWDGWCALARHGLLSRDRLPGEPLTLHVPAQDLGGAVSAARAALALDGWTTIEVPVHGTARVVAITGHGSTRSTRSPPSRCRCQPTGSA